VSERREFNGWKAAAITLGVLCVVLTLYSAAVTVQLGKVTGQFRKEAANFESVAGEATKCQSYAEEALRQRDECRERLAVWRSGE
jgi:3-deoxy-D-arabino-heptulosonate 7-phosphate (DAHP) synthase class II